MDDLEIRQAVEKRIGISRIVWFALFSSVLIYTGLGLYLHNMSGFASAPSELPVAIGWTLMVLGISSAAFGSLTASRAIIFPKVVGDTLDSRYRSAQSGLIISWALCESAAVFGLVVFFLYRSREDLIVMVVVSALSLIGSFPTESKFIERIKDRAP